MSSIENVITTTFRARAGQAIASMGGYAGSVGQVGRAINETTRMSERLNSQWRAIGTTMRYAVAGGAVFGLTRMIGQLRDVQQQLGLMQAIAQPAGGGILSTAAVDRLGTQLQRSAVRSLTPINEINDATVNLLSTVQNVPQSEIPDIITDIGRAAKLSQTPIEDLTKAATTMNIAFGRSNNARNIAQFNRQWFSLIKEAPGGVHAAPEIAAQLPQIASMFALGKGPVSGAQSQSQMMALVLGALRTGSTPSTGLRGLTYLLQSIIQPTGKARGALAGIGITSQSIEREGINANLMRLLNAITHTGTARQRTQSANLSDDAISSIDENGGTLPGVPASEMQHLRTMIPRIHGIRAAVILAGQLRGNSQVLSLGQDLDLMNRSRQDTVDETHSMARAWDDFRKRSRLQEASIALGTMRLQTAQAFEPLINTAAGGLTGVAGLAQRHPRATRDIALAGAAIVASLGVGRFLGITGRRFGSGSSLVRANAVQAAISGATGLGATPQNPMYVTVVGQLFGGNTNAPGPDTPNAPTATRFGKLRNFGRKVAPPVGGLVAGEAVGAGALALGGIALPVTALALAAYLGDKYDPNHTKHSALEKVMDANNRNQMPGSAMPALNAKPGSLYGTFDVNVKHPDGTVDRKRIHVPLDQWSNGRVPSSRGTAGKTR